MKQTGEKNSKMWCYCSKSITAVSRGTQYIQIPSSIAALGEGTSETWGSIPRDAGPTDANPGTVAVEVDTTDARSATQARHQGLFEKRITKRKRKEIKQIASQEEVPNHVQAKTAIQALNHGVIVCCLAKSSFQNEKEVNEDSTLSKQFLAPWSKHSNGFIWNAYNGATITLQGDHRYQDRQKVRKLRTERW